MARRHTFQDARCLVTGASSGLGRALAQHLVDAGARLLVTGRTPEKLRAVADSLAARAGDRDRIIAASADLTLPEDRQRLFDVASARLGALDLVVNSAGVGAYGHFDTHDESVIRRVFEINLFALVEVTRAALPMLRLGRTPALVNIGSIVARRGLPGRSEYSASKFAVAGFTESIRAEWSRFGIDVLLVNPGFTATDFERNLVANTSIYPTTDRRAMTPDQVARAILSALRLGKTEVALSAEGKLLLLANRISPRFVDRGFRRFVLRIFPADSIVENIKTHAG